MMSKLIKSESFIETSRRTVNGFEYIDGTVELTLRGVTKTVPATKTSSGCIIAKGISGRYATGSKVWPACVVETIIGNGSIVEVIKFGRDDRNPKFNKLNAVFFD